MIVGTFFIAFIFALSQGASTSSLNKRTRSGATMVTAHPQAIQNVTLKGLKYLYDFWEEAYKADPSDTSSRRAVYTKANKCYSNNGALKELMAFWNLGTFRDLFTFLHVLNEDELELAKLMMSEDSRLEASAELFETLKPTLNIRNMDDIKYDQSLLKAESLSPIPLDSVGEAIARIHMYRPVWIEKRVAREKEARDKAAREKAEREKAAREKAEQERAAREKAEHEREAKEAAVKKVLVEIGLPGDGTVFTSYHDEISSIIKDLQSSGSNINVVFVSDNTK